MSVFYITWCFILRRVCRWPIVVDSVGVLLYGNIYPCPNLLLFTTGVRYDDKVLDQCLSFSNKYHVSFNPVCILSIKTEKIRQIPWYNKNRNDSANKILVNQTLAQCRPSAKYVQPTLTQCLPFSNRQLVTSLRMLLVSEWVSDKPENWTWRREGLFSWKVVHKTYSGMKGWSQTPLIHNVGTTPYQHYKGTNLKSF